MDNKQMSAGNGPYLEMRLSEIKLFLYETVGKQLECAGYRFKKSNFSFKKKIASDIIQFVFFFNDYAPLRFEIYFAIFVTNEKMQTIKANLPIKPTMVRFDIQTVLFFFGDYMAEAKNDLNNNIRRNYRFPVTTNKDLFAFSEQLKLILSNEILPEVEQMFTAEGIARFFKKRQIWWSTSSLDLNNILAELMSTKIGFPGDYGSVYIQMVEEIQRRVGVSLPEQDLAIVAALNEKLRNM